MDMDVSSFFSSFVSFFSSITPFSSFFTGFTSFVSSITAITFASFASFASFLSSFTPTRCINGFSFPDGLDTSAFALPPFPGFAALPRFPSLTGLALACCCGEAMARTASTDCWLRRIWSSWRSFSREMTKRMKRTPSALYVKRNGDEYMICTTRKRTSSLLNTRTKYMKRTSMEKE